MIKKSRKNDMTVAQSERNQSDALRIVREFQKQYRQTNSDGQSSKYQWTTNPGSATEGVLRQRNYFQDSQSI